MTLTPHRFENASLAGPLFLSTFHIVDPAKKSVLYRFVWLRCGGVGRRRLHHVAMYPWTSGGWCGSMQALLKEGGTGPEVPAAFP